MKIDPYLNFNGQCAEAFKLYERVLGGTIEGMTTHGASPMAADVPSTVAMLPRADVILAGEPREWEAVEYVFDTALPRSHKW